MSGTQFTTKFYSFKGSLKVNDSFLSYAFLPVVEKVAPFYLSNMLERRKKEKSGNTGCLGGSVS